MSDGLRWRLLILRRLLPVLLVVAILLGLVIESLFQQDQSQRLAQLRETGIVATRLLAAAQAAIVHVEDAAAARQQVQALIAAGTVAEALGQSFAGTEVAASWIAPAPSMAPLAAQWKSVAGNAQALAGLVPANRELLARARALESAFVRMRVNSNALLDELVKGEGKPAQLRGAARQLALVERLVAGARALAGDLEILAWADRVGRDAVAFGDIINALENGSKSLKIPRVLDREARDILAGLAREFRQIVPALEPVLNQASRWQDLAAPRMALEQTLHRAGELGREAWLALEQRAQERFPRPLHLIWLALLGILSGIAIGLSGARERWAAEAERARAETASARRLEDLQQAREAQRRQLQQLAQSIAKVADGHTELRRQPEQDEDSVLTAAFSALERLTDRMREHADQGLRLVHGGALLTDLTRSLRDESRRQGEVMEQMSLATRDMASGLDPLTREGEEAGDAARSSSAQARQAGDAVSRTVVELEALQTSAEECARRVQRLEDAGRQMLSVRELTEDVSELGKLLSLNAAIQASVDSEASRALGNFSAEVQRLSERARSAMLRIDVVHRDLRDEAQQAAKAINDSLLRARSAMTRARGAGTSLDSLDEAARRLEAIGEGLERRQREHAHRVTSVVRSITALHQATAVLRGQVDVTVDSSTALADAGTSFEQGLQRRSGGHAQLLAIDGGRPARGSWPSAAPEPEPAGDEVSRVLDPR